MPSEHSTKPTVRSVSRLRRHTTIFALGFLLFATACNDCEDVSTTYEAVEGEAFYDYILGQVEQTRERGGTCAESAIRDAFGVRIGTRFRCTECV